MTELFASLALGLVLSASPPASHERIVCVPGEAGGWECGKGENAPAPRSLPPSAAPTRQSTPPPIYLMDPARMPKVVRESFERGDYEGAQDAGEHLPPVEAAALAPPSEPVVATPPPAEVRQNAARMQSNAQAAVAASATANIAPVAVVEPVVASEPVVEPEPQPVAATEPDPQATPEPAPAAPVVLPQSPPAAAAQLPERTDPVILASAPRAQRSIASVARDVSELLALPADAYTVQLAAARNIQGFAAFRIELGIAVEDTFVIKVDRGEESWWLMLWRDFPNVESARAAISQLPNKPKGIWPRRLAPLQAEVRRTPSP